MIGGFFSRFERSVHAKRALFVEGQGWNAKVAEADGYPILIRYDVFVEATLDGPVDVEGCNLTAPHIPPDLRRTKKLRAESEEPKS